MIDPIVLSGACRSAAANGGLGLAEPHHPLHDGPDVPAWVMDEFIGASIRRQQVFMTTTDRVCTVCTRVLEGVAMVSVWLPNAQDLMANEFRLGAGEVYQIVRSSLANTPAPHPVRMWNFIPGIHRRLDGDLDRYQVFNQARHAAFSEWLGDPSRFAAGLPTATGVGHSGSALVVHALGSARLGQPQENPRQCPAYRYSRTGGPRPPCFSRAVVASLPKGPKLLISGTASVRGEESVQIGSLAGQLEELLENLRNLPGLVGQGSRGALESIREVRFYHRRAEDRDQLRAEIARRFTGARRVEAIQADICRRELLVEVEAVADVIAGSIPDPLHSNHWAHAFT